MKANWMLALVTAALAATSFPATAGTPPSRDDGHGVPVTSATRADQVIVVTDATRSVNVTGGSTVRFIVGDRAFNWYFGNGGAFVDAFDLATIAPPGVLRHAVTVYVAGDPMYR